MLKPGVSPAAQVRDEGVSGTCTQVFSGKDEKSMAEVWQ